MASPNIFQSLLRPVKSVADYDSDYDMAEGNKLKLAAARMGMEQSQRGAQQAEARRQAFAASGGNGKAYRNALQQIGDYAGVQEFDTQEQARAKGASDLDTADVARRKSEVEIIDKSLATAKTFANQIQTPQQAQAYLQGLYNDPVLGKVAERLMPYEQAVQQIPQDEAGLLRWKAGHMAITGDKLIDLLKPKTDITNMGASQSFGATDQFTGQRTQTGSQAITQSADNAATQATSIENNKRSTGATLAVAGAARDQAAATRDAARITADSKRQQDTEMKLADDYRTESKGWAETSTAMKKVLVALKTATTNAGSALAAGTGFMKILDPNSVVRESELGMALNASGWFDRAMNVAQKLQSGTVMTKTQQANLEAAARDLFKEAKAAQLEVDKAYETRAKSYGVNPRNIITDRGQNTPDEPAAAKDQPANGWGAVKVN